MEQKVYQLEARIYELLQEKKENGLTDKINTFTYQRNFTKLLIDTKRVSLENTRLTHRIKSLENEIRNLNTELISAYDSFFKDPPLHLQSTPVLSTTPTPTSPTSKTVKTKPKKRPSIIKVSTPTKKKNVKNCKSETPQIKETKNSSLNIAASTKYNGSNKDMYSDIERKINEENRQKRDNRVTTYNSMNQEIQEKIISKLHSKSNHSTPTEVLFKNIDITNTISPMDKTKKVIANLSKYNAPKVSKVLSFDDRDEQDSTPQITPLKSMDSDLQCGEMIDETDCSETKMSLRKSCSSPDLLKSISKLEDRE